MRDLSKTIQTNGGFCVIYKFGSSNLIPEILLVQRRQNGKWELPGGQVDYHTDDPNDPFQCTAIREAFEESGVAVNPKEVECEMFLQQLKKHGEEWFIGTVGMYSFLVRNADDVDLSFTSDETSAIKFVSVTEMDFNDSNIMLAARRMIAHFYVNYTGSIRRKWAGNLGSEITFDLLGRQITV